MGMTSANVLKVGDQLGGVEILEVVTAAKYARDCQYLVLYECCRIKGVLDHLSIKRRATRPVVPPCPQCKAHGPRKLDTASDPPVVILPTWEPTTAGRLNVGRVRW
jgi:hypothetical protein